MASALGSAAGLKQSAVAATRPRHLLLLPGLMCDGTFWEPLQAAVPANTHCTVVDYGDADTLTAMAQAALAAAPPQFSLLAVARADGVRAMCGEWLKGMVHPGRLDDTALLASITDMFARKNASLFASQLNALLTRPDTSPVLAGLQAMALPTMLLCGRQDSWANVAQHEAMQALAPQSSLCIIEDAGHMVLMERPSETVHSLFQFLD